MEIIWYILASLGAGISKGLAGLSAVMIMVPILIVLCPSGFLPVIITTVLIILRLF